MNCEFGRTYNPEHRSCISCKAQGVSTCNTKKKKTRHENFQAYNKGKVLICTKDLRSPNDWTNKEFGKRIYQGEKRAWKKMFMGTIFLWGRATGKRRLKVTRYVAQKGHFMKDRTNIEGSMKPLEDALTEEGVLLDDEMALMERESPRQIVDAVFPRVEIEVEDIV
jgi:hypothetical protein